MIPNAQPAEGLFHSTDDTLEVHSIFPTIQGEGPFAGCPAIFVRLAGCNLQCPWCDTDYTSKRELMRAEDVGVEVMSRVTNEDLVVITGGEPFRQSGLPALVRAIRKWELRVQIETNGTLDQPNFPWNDSEVTVVCSPKTPRINPVIAAKAHCYKYVISAEQVALDGLPSGVLGDYRMVARPHPAWRGTIYVQPADEHDANRNALNIAAAVESVRTKGHRLCLQLHKYIDLP